MQYFKLSGGQEMPVFGLGTWKSEKGEVYRAVCESVQQGYNHVDCAPIYGNEPEVGEALSEVLRSGQIARKDLWVTSKLWNDAHAPENVLPALQKTLSDLHLEYLDLFLIHWPVVFAPGVGYPQSGDEFLPLEALPISETWKAMEECVKKGLVRAIGVSNFSIKKLDQLLRTAVIAPAVNQIELHPFLQQKDMLAYCADKNVRLTAYAPLGSGDRPDRMKGADEPSLLKHPVIADVAAKHGATPGQILIKWAVTRGTVVIPKSVNPKRIKENIESLSIDLDQEDMEQIASLDRHFRYVTGSFWQPPGSPYTMENLWDEK
ncbi:aldo/keto reductase [Desulfogranum japonicum]|uniref:aldo/keto reductase n=1 Tax=Desulfogranum japonicum TaxID=231447 RepID=UPI00040FBBF8|nr:aldo/keto reductase [Desulfogranum japonicum]